jgi:hypothetical protein
MKLVFVTPGEMYISEPCILHPAFCTLRSKPETRHLKPEARNLKPETWNPKPGTRILKPETPSQGFEESLIADLFGIGKPNSETRSPTHENTNPKV